MNNYFYSKKSNGFYPASMKGIYELSPDGWPSDAVEVSEEDYNNLYSGQAKGKKITADDKGYPVLIDPPGPTQEELIAAAEEKRDMLIAEAAIKIAPLQDAIDLDEATQDEQIQLTAWKKYRVSLNRIDISSPQEIVWPGQP